MLRAFCHARSSAFRLSQQRPAVRVLSKVACVDVDTRWGQRGGAAHPAAGTPRRRVEPLSTLSAAPSDAHPNPVIAAMLTRRTIGDFTTEPVDEAAVLSAVEAARWAPNHRLTEPWKFYLLGDRTIEQVAALAAARIEAAGNPKRAAKKYELWRHTPGWIVVTSKRSPDDAFVEKGFGSKWSTGDVIQTTEMAELVGYNLEEETPVGIVYFGKVAREKQSVRRRGLDDVLVRVP